MANYGSEIHLPRVNSMAVTFHCLHGSPRPFVSSPGRRHRSRLWKSAQFCHSGGGSDGSGGGGDENHAQTDFEEHNHRGGSLWMKALLMGMGLITARQAKHILEKPRWLIDTESARVSVVIPVLNEEKQIEATLEGVRDLEPPVHEVIVVDGGSTDRTVQLARAAGATVLLSEKGRARQMNLGAQHAAGDILCFLHADSAPPRSLVTAARRALVDSRTVLGGFRTTIRLDGRPLFMTAHQFVKTYYLPLLLRPLSFIRGARCLFGDQTMFCRASDFRRVGGFDGSLPIMEDADLCIRLHEAGPQPPRAPAVQGADNSSDLASRPQRPLDGVRKWTRRRGQVIMVNNPHAQTSGRRLQAWGNAHATAVHFIIGMSWYLGATPEQMRSLYERLYTDAHR